MFHGCKPNRIMERSTNRHGQWRWGGGITEVGVVGVQVVHNDPEDDPWRSSQHGMRCSTLIKHGEAMVHQEHAQRSKNQLVGVEAYRQHTMTVWSGGVFVLGNNCPGGMNRLPWQVNFGESNIMVVKSTEFSAAIAAV